jgi:pimeloyl-ACP methyl ester carboxylesterase
MDIEEVAEHTPHLIFTEEIDPAVGLQGFQARRIAFNLGLSGNAFKEMTKFVDSLYKAYVGSDASLFEINPVLKWFRQVELNIPTLYVMGEEDYMFLPSVKQVVANHVKTAELFIIQNCGHVVNVEQPIIFNQQVIAYIKSK